jgi:hypothetical protein
VDLRVYYQKLREAAAQIAEEFPVVVSKETPDGGKQGLCTEVTRAIAARMITEGVARLAATEETKAFRDAQAEAKRQADQAADAARVQFTVISTAEMAKLTGSKKEKA